MGFVVGGSFVWAISQPNQAQHVDSANTGTNAHADQNQPAKSLRERLSIIWDRTWNDPVAFYTLILGIFTALLALVSMGQGWFLYRADKTARRTADAALMHARAAVAADSPILVINGIKLVQYPSAASQEAMADHVEPGPIPSFCRILVSIGNEGRTILRLIELCIEQLVAPQLPAGPTYISVEALGGGLRAGQSLWFRSGDLISGVTLSNADSVAIAAGSSYFWVYGYVGYLDLLGQPQQHKFLTRWDIHHGFVPEQRANYT
jgi:hypothetical protein